MRYESADFSLSYCIRQQAFSSMVGRGGAFVAHQADMKGWTLLTQDIQTFLFLRNSAGQGFNNNGHGVNVDTPNRWLRCTYTVKHDGSISLYVDDFLMSQGSKMVTPFAQATGTPLVIGRSVDALEHGTPAWQLSDVILYDRVLTPKEVYDYGQYGIVNRPVGRWKLDGNLEDSSGFGNHASTADGLTYVNV
ncbi:LamG-like jellyroll fold domain-containing protein [Janthinobacterium sp. GB4P2]|uniref:LamG-like jellyroll fold domain-containing protein n=1 Tax=Janthinobacterium sp. GB4P2 TaxID=3424189 RepID=UPI003F2332CC